MAELGRLPPFRLIYDCVQGIGNQNLKESVAFLLPRAPWNKARAAKVYGRRERPFSAPDPVAVVLLELSAEPRGDCAVCCGFFPLLGLFLELFDSHCSLLQSTPLSGSLATSASRRIGS